MKDLFHFVKLFWSTFKFGVLQYLFCCRCDADPAALAKYIVALIKKDKPESSLRETCTDQLDVFLQDSAYLTMFFDLKLSEKPFDK